MHSNYKPVIKHINVGMSIGLYESLKAYMSFCGFRTNLSFIVDALHGVQRVVVNLLEIDGGPASTMSALLQIGECVHKWTGETFILLPEPQALQLIYERGGV